MLSVALKTGLGLTSGLIVVIMGELEYKSLAPSPSPLLITLQRQDLLTDIIFEDWYLSLNCTLVYY